MGRDRIPAEAPPPGSRDSQIGKEVTLDDAPIEELARQWLAAERRAADSPESAALNGAAVGLGHSYEQAIASASQEDLLLAFEAARRELRALEIGSATWDEARRVSELLRFEYEARVGPRIGGAFPQRW
jgi:hypothetical protein